MKKLNLLFALIFICGFSVLSSAITVHITSPVSGSTVSSPVKINASASSGHRITGWWIYVDNVAVWKTGATPSISPSISMSAGIHRVTARAWNSTGAYSSANLTLTVRSSTPPPTAVSISISPGSAVLQTNASVQFNASVSGTTNTAVTWLVGGVLGGNSTLGTISSTGLYKAPVAVPSGSSVIVTAKSAADTTKSASATISISALPAAVSVSISPTTATLQAGQSKQFTASVTGTTNTGINWQVAGMNGGNSTVGTISSTGLYNAPATAFSGTATVTARSAYDSTKAANATVSVTAAPSSTGKNYYISPSGSDSNAGTESSPWATINRANSAVVAGDTVHALPGTYNVSSISTTKSGTSSARITYVSDTKWGAKLVIGSMGTCWINSGTFVDIKGFDVTESPSGGCRIGILNYASNVRILNNRVHDLTRHPDIAGCSSNGGAGIDHFSSTSTNVEASGNMVFNIGNPTVHTCNFTQGIYIAMRHAVVKNNLVFEIASFGIKLGHFVSHVDVVNNTVFNNGKGGIWIGGNDDNSADDFNHVNNNIVYNSASGTGINAAYSNATSNSTFLNNLVYGNATNWYFGAISAAHSGDVTAAPAFVNYTGNSSGDYRLQPNSPAVDKGSSVSAPVIDIDGGPRPHGVQFDIGAYELGVTPAAWPW